MSDKLYSKESLIELARLLIINGVIFIIPFILISILYYVIISELLPLLFDYHTCYSLSPRFSRQSYLIYFPFVLIGLPSLFLFIAFVMNRSAVCVVFFASLSATAFWTYEFNDRYIYTYKLEQSGECRQRY